MAIKDTIRLFTAILLPPEQLAFLGGVQQSLKDSILPHHWRAIPKDNLHITLNFIGNAPISYLSDLMGRLYSISLVTFTVVLKDVELIQRGQNGALIWVKAEANENLAYLSSQIHQALYRESLEKSRFIPHVTLFRINDANNIKSLKNQVEKISSPPITVKGKGFSLMESRMSHHGVVYFERSFFS